MGKASYYSVCGPAHTKRHSTHVASGYTSICETTGDLPGHQDCRFLLLVLGADCGLVLAGSLANCNNAPVWVINGE